MNMKAVIRLISLKENHILKIVLYIFIWKFFLIIFFGILRFDIDIIMDRKPFFPKKSKLCYEKIYW